jgi:hypothetical protein
MAIISLSDLRAHVKIAGTADDTLLQFYITSAQSAIEAHTRRVFDAGTVESTRYYANDPYLFNGQRLYLDHEVLSVSELVNGNGGTIDSADYWLQPRNEPPYAIIELKTNETWNWNTDGEVAVTGVWGYSGTAPYDVQEACRELATYYYRVRSSSVFETVGTPDGPSMPIPRGLPKNVADLLAPYRRRTR